MKPNFRICVPAPDIIDGNLGDGMDEILGMNKGEHAGKHPLLLTEQATVVPVVVVARSSTSLSRVLFEIASGTLDLMKKRRRPHMRLMRDTNSPVVPSFLGAPGMWRLRLFSFKY